MNRLSHILVLLFLFSGIWPAIVQSGEASRPSAPSITPDGGRYPPNAPIRVSIRSEPGSVVIYTLDDSDPGWSNGIRSESNLVFFDLPPGDVVVKATTHSPGRPLSQTRVARFFRGDG